MMFGPFTMGKVTAGQAAKLNEMARQLDGLSRLGVSAPLTMTRTNGIPVISSLGTGVFPAELTSSFDATTGYDFKRLVLDKENAGFDDQLIESTGDYAFDVTGDETLTSGERVLMWPAPSGTYQFQKAGAGSAAAIDADITNISAALISTVIPTWTSCGTITLPGTGKYRVYYVASGNINASSAPARLDCRLSLSGLTVDNPAPGDFFNDTHAVVVNAATTGVTHVGTSGNEWTADYTISGAGPMVVTLEAATSVAVTSANILSTGVGFGTKLGYVRYS